MTCRCLEAKRILGVVVLGAVTGGSFAGGPQDSDGAPPFDAAATVAVNAKPAAVEVVDLDGDGANDLVTANPSSDTVSVLIGRGDGRYRAPRTDAVAGGPVDLTAADFDGDGSVDIATVNRDGNTVSVLLGNGDGTLRAPRSSTTGVRPISLAAADFNGDGVADLATANLQEGEDGPDDIAVLIGIGDGTFESPQFLPVGPSPDALTAADFDGDGNVDLAAANSFPARDISVLLGDGSGGFTTQRRTALEFVAGAMAATDFDGDGRLDLAVSGRGGAALLMGRGDGRFSPTHAIDADGRSLAVADFDADGTPDLAIAGTDRLRVLRGNGDGSFGPGRGHIAGGRGALAAADLDRDGVVDLAKVNRNRIGVLIGNGDGTFPGATSSAVSFDVPELWAPLSVAVTDFNGDGLRDVAIGGVIDPITEFTGVKVLLGRAEGGFDEGPLLDVGRRPEAIVAADFDGDGITDLATSGDVVEPRVNVLFGNGDGSFTAVQQLSAPNRPVALTAADFDADGTMDLAAAGNSAVHVFLGSAGRSFAARGPFPVGMRAVAIVAADVDGDGNPDLATANRASNDVSVLAGDGEGGFADIGDFAAGIAPSAITAADFDDDGHTDLATSNINNADDGPDDVTVLVGDGSGGFDTGTAPAVGSTPSTIVAADVDGDTVVDLVTVNNDSRDATVLSGTGDGSFAPARTVLAGPDLDDAVVTDFDGDGAVDLVTDQGLVLVNRGRTELPGAAAGSLSGAWFDPDRSGEGIVVEMLPDRRGRISWFTYSPEGEQAWIVGSGPVVGSTLRIQDAFRGRGGRFGDAFDPQAVEIERWGSMRLSFMDCDRASFDFDGPPAFGSGSQSLVRLTRIRGLPCEPASESELALGLTGAWFDRERSGEGLVMEELPDGRVRVSWFTYRPEGGQAWIIGNGPIEDDQVAIDNAFIARGGVFGDAFDPAAIEFVLWGDLEIRFTGCDSAILAFDPIVGDFQSGEQTLSRLTRLAGTECRL